MTVTPTLPGLAPATPEGPRPGSRAARMLMPRSVDVVKDLAADYGVCTRPVSLRRTDLDSGRTEVIDMPCGATAGTVDLDPMVASALRRHMQEYPPTEVELIDVTSGHSVRRRVPLLFTTTHKNPFTDRTWSAEWVKWREKTGWPKENGGFHALRHFFATTLITNHVDPKEVQRALRHSTLQITLVTYVHFWPRRERRRGVVGDVLRAAASGQDHR